MESLNIYIYWVGGTDSCRELIQATWSFPEISLYFTWNDTYFMGPWVDHLPLWTHGQEDGTKRCRFRRKNGQVSGHRRLVWPRDDRQLPSSLSGRPVNSRFSPRLSLPSTEKALLFQICSYQQMVGSSSLTFRKHSAVWPPGHLNYSWLWTINIPRHLRKHGCWAGEAELNGRGITSGNRHSKGNGYV